MRHRRPITPELGRLLAVYAGAWNRLHPSLAISAASIVAIGKPPATTINRDPACVACRVAIAMRMRDFGASCPEIASALHLRSHTPVVEWLRNDALLENATPVYDLAKSQAIAGVVMPVIRNAPVRMSRIGVQLLRLATIHERNGEYEHAETIREAASLLDERELAC